MSEREHARLVAHGAVVFLLGMASGFPFAFVILGKIALWPFPTIDWTVPGDVRGWHMAHLEGILNAMMLFAIAAVGPRLTLTAGQHRLLVTSLLITAWGNQIASMIGPLFGVRGLEAGAGFANSLVFTLFMIAIVTVVIAFVLVYRGARASMRAA